MSKLREKSLRWCPGCKSEAAALGDFNRVDKDGGLDEDGEYFCLHIMCGDCLTWRYVHAHEDDCNLWEDDVLTPAHFELSKLSEAADLEIFEHQAAIFVEALKLDLIGPEDFV